MKFIRFHSAYSHIPALFKMSAFIVFFVLVAPGNAATDDAHLSPGVPLLVLPGTPSSVRTAVADLQRDLQKVLGQPSPIVDGSEGIARSPGHRDCRGRLDPACMA
jgi:hypothetical protein